MIPASTERRQTSANWQQQQAAGYRRPLELLAVLGLADELGPQLAGEQMLREFPLRVPRGFVRRMRHGDADDPLLRQVLPLALESVARDGFVDDPVAESPAQRAPGLLQKYAGRALLITTGACAVHCRYCFRRAFPYAGQVDDSARWQSAIDVIATDPSLEELILSGGDPLTLSDGRLADLSARLQPLPHLKRLRIHTRQPIVLPARVDPGFVAWLGSLPWKTTVVLHCNHPNEIDAEVAAACARLRAAGATLLNQSVLLAGVNDDAGVLASLSRRLFDCDVLPYYLHLLDPVRGAAHFDVSETRARGLMTELARTLPGYLLPRLVREIPSRAAKTVISAGLHPT
jgi:EF-P beta-lysylation protein EpmB